jgi:hypothetical protein
MRFVEIQVCKRRVFALRDKWSLSAAAVLLRASIAFRSCVPDTPRWVSRLGLLKRPSREALKVTRQVAAYIYHPGLRLPSRSTPDT